MRYQWITRVLGNPLVLSDTVMEPFAREVLAQAAGDGKPVVLILDQSKVSDRHQVLMLALRYGDRALPLEQSPGGSRGNNFWLALLTRHEAMEVVMPRPSSGALRERVLLACEQGEGSRAAIARRFRVGESTLDT